MISALHDWQLCIIVTGMFMLLCMQQNVLAIRKQHMIQAHTMPLCAAALQACISVLFEQFKINLERVRTTDLEGIGKNWPQILMG